MASDLDETQDPLDLLRLGYAGPLLQHKVRRWEQREAVERIEPVAEEIPVTIAYNRLPHAVMMATPTDLEDFALGFSITEELIGSPSELKTLEVVRYSRGIELLASVSDEVAAAVKERTRRLTGRTGCGICGADSVAAVFKELRPVAPGAVVTVDAIHKALLALNERQTYNAATGTVHAAAWATAQGELQDVREDVGRHNALDKLIGALLKRDLDARSGFVVLTSRASFEMVTKAARASIEIIIAAGAPSSLAIEAANRWNLTLSGSARSGRANLYTHAQRIDIS